MARNGYFEWLCDRIEAGAVMPEQSYIQLCHALHSSVYYALVPNDDNRGADGIDLRQAYFSCTGRRVSMDDPCSVFEMLVALADRIAFQLEGYDGVLQLNAKDYFWMMIRNLGLEKCTDDVLINEPDEMFVVRNAVEKLLNREYKPDGSCGGLFPLKNADKDQRNVEIWYQMHRYLLENFV